MRYCVISLDLDGTLVDTAGEIAEAVNRTLAEFGLERQSEAFVARFIGGGARNTMLRVLAHLLNERSELAPQLPPDAVLQRLEAHYGATAGTVARPYPGAAQALEDLVGAGVRLACLTNKERRFARRVLKHAGLYDLFDLVVCGDSLPVRKPDRGTLDHVLNVLGAERHRAAHLGDSSIDVETARGAGVEAWAVPYGYAGDRSVLATRPDRVFNTLGEMAQYVLRANAETLIPA